MATPTITRSLLTNKAFGFPDRGGARRTDPLALICVHITANPNKPPATAAQERQYANRAASGGPSAHFYIDRDGSALQAVDWTTYAAWSNGDVNKPRPVTQPVQDLRAKGFNANEAYWIEAECCGNDANGYPIVVDQINTLAYLTALASQFSGLAISRDTVHGHSDLNTVTRASCPTPLTRLESLLSEVIQKARVIANDMLINDLRTQIAAQADMLDKANGKADELALAVSRLEQALTGALAAADDERHEWLNYSDEVKSRAGGILALDPPTVEES